MTIEPQINPLGHIECRVYGVETLACSAQSCLVIRDLFDADGVDQTASRVAPSLSNKHKLAVLNQSTTSALAGCY